MSIFQRPAVRAAVIQSPILQGDKETNWRRASALVEQAMVEGPHLVVLPEAFISGVNFIILRQMAEPVPEGPSCERIWSLARRHRVHLVAGVLEVGDDDCVYDSAIVVDPSGEILGHYRRRFLWVGERNYVSPGRLPVVVSTELGRIGLTVGYDLSFPEACSHFLENDVDLGVCCASIFTRLAFNARHLALARAMDHHCFFLFANAVGHHPFANMTYSGQSGIYADAYFLQTQMNKVPEATLGRLAEAGDEAEILVADLHLEELAKARRKLPFKDDARFTRELEAAPSAL